MVSPFCSPSSTPRKSRKSHGGNNKDKESKNPYSNRGLDKFSSLLAELEEKRQKIYSQMGQEDIALVRFVYRSSNECVPVVIKSKEKTNQEDNKRVDQEIKEISATHESTQYKEPLKRELKRTESKTDKKPCKLNVKLHKMTRPSYYLPVSVILILMFLAFFGRSVAILLTCVGWYMVPMIRDRRSNERISMKKKDYVRRLSYENKGSPLTTTPRRRDCATLKEKFPCQSDNRKSW